MNRYQVPFFDSAEKLACFVKEADRELEARMIDTARSVAKIPDLRLLGLTGPSCAGKTTAARLMTDYLERHGRHVYVISIDDFYYDKAYLNKRAEDDPNIEIDYDSESTIDTALLSEKTESLLACRKTQLPRFDFQSGVRVEGKCILPSPDDVFLFEGIQVLYPKVRAMLEKHSYRSIFICPSSSIEVGGEVFLPNEIRLLRRLVRDRLHRATELAFTFYLWQSVRENEEENIFPYAANCHYTIDSVLPYEIGMLRPYLEKELSMIKPDNPYFDEARTLLERIASVQSVPVDYRTQNSLYKEFI